MAKEKPPRARASNLFLTAISTIYEIAGPRLFLENCPPVYPFIACFPRAGAAPISNVCRFSTYRMSHIPKRISENRRPMYLLVQAQRLFLTSIAFPCEKITDPHLITASLQPPRGASLPQKLESKPSVSYAFAKKDKTAGIPVGNPTGL